MTNAPTRDAVLWALAAAGDAGITRSQLIATVWGGFAAKSAPMVAIHHLRARGYVIELAGRYVKGTERAYRLLAS